MSVRFDNPRRTLDLLLQFLFIDGRIEVLATNLDTLVATRLDDTGWSVAFVGADTVHLTACTIDPPSPVRLKLLGTADGDHDLEGPAMLVELAPPAGATGIRFAVEVAHHGQEQRVLLEILAPTIADPQVRDISVSETPHPVNVQRTDLVGRPVVVGGPKGPSPNPHMPSGWFGGLGPFARDMQELEHLLRERVTDIASGDFTVAARELAAKLTRWR
jgi:hypothetical protein